MSTFAELEQRKYYAETAAEYEQMHLHGDQETDFAISLLPGLISTLGIRSILDLGSGTGRALYALKVACPNVKLLGVEPVPEMREIGYRNGLTRDELVGGDAQALAFNDNSFDLVCEFAMLHHVPKPAVVVGEMLRVAKRAIFISDSNNFGQGSVIARLVKQLLNAAGLWPAANWVKTRGKIYNITPGDGLAYSYSVFNNYQQIAKACQRVHVTNIGGDGHSAYRNSPHVALIGIK